MDILKDLEKREIYLKQAFIPTSMWEQCVILEDGSIFTSQENYKTYLENKDKPVSVELTLEQKLVKELAETKLSIIEIKSKLGGRG